MGTTAKRSLRWPTATVGVKPNVAQDIRNLAEDVDAALTGAVIITDWNAVTSTGSYFGNSNSANSPQGSTSPHFGYVISNGTGGLEQVAGRADGGTGTNPMFHRYYSTSAASWTAWAQLMDDVTLATAPAIDSTDLNALLTSGIYRGQNLTNAPGGSSYIFYIHNLIRSTNGVQIAYSVDSSDLGIYRRVRTSSAWGPWTQLATVNDTGWTGLPIVPASGWGTRTDPAGHTTAPLVGGVRNRNGAVEYRFRLTRTSSTPITSSASGNIGGDPVIATVDPGTYPQFVPTGEVDGAFSVVGVQAGVARIDQLGQISISALYPNDAINQNDIIQVSLFFLAG